MAITTGHIPFQVTKAPSTPKKKVSKSVNKPSKKLKTEILGTQKAPKK